MQLITAVLVCNRRSALNLFWVNLSSLTYLFAVSLLLPRGGKTSFQFVKNVLEGLEETSHTYCTRNST